MQIKEVEEKTGLTRSNIRFYEKQGLFMPHRNPDSGYREYTEENVRDIEKIAFLRSLGISVEQIRAIISGDSSLTNVVREQESTLSEQIDDLQRAKKLCQQILADEQVDYQTLAVERYVTDLGEYWRSSSEALRHDIAGFLEWFGGKTAWSVITVLCFLIAAVSYAFLPEKIPVQWKDSEVTNLVDKMFIFAYPAACAAIRFGLRPVIWRWFWLRGIPDETIADCLTNFFCFAVLAVEVFTVL